MSGRVVAALESTYSKDLPPTVEDIQDIVERTLIKSGHAETAKAYILYRHERARMRSRASTASARLALAVASAAL